MKKGISSILVLIIIITSLTVSFGSGTLNKILLKENGIGRNFEVLNLKIDGETIKSEDVPPVMYVLNNQGRTLVPLRMIIEHLADKLNADIEWDQDKYEVKVITNDKEIVLKIDSPIALVNGVEKRLPDNVPAKLLALGSVYNARTLVPIRFFAEELGLNVDWDNDTRTAIIEYPEEDDEDNSSTDPQPPLENIVDITDVKVEMNGHMPQIRIKATGQVDYKEFKLVNPDRLVIDLNNAKFNLINKDVLEANGTLNIQTNNELIKNVRVSQFQNNPFITRVVMELGKSTEHQITFDDKTGEIVIDFVNYIRDVKKELINAKEVIIVEGDAVSDYTTMHLSNPERLVVDIKGGVLHSNFKTNTINVDGKIAKTIRVSQFDSGNDELAEKIVRIVIDLQENADYEEAFVEVIDNNLNIHLEGEPFKAIKYEETGWTSSRFTLLGSTVTRYSIGRNTSPNLIEVTVPKDDIELELANLNVDDHIIKSIDISEDKSNYNIKLELQDSVEYNVVSPEKSKDFVLELNNKAAKYREMLVVIDPGHGGSDPGNVSSIFNVHESVIVLDISLRFNRLLTDAGFRTYMTRVDNLNPSTKLSLQERTDVANALNANLFISIHANSFKTSTPNGIENFYYPGDTESKTIAQIFQNEMIKDLNAIDRGAKSADYFVLRNTKMPAILSETGFLSNPSEGQKLINPEYRQQIAESMFNATVKYFEQTRK